MSIRYKISLLMILVACVSFVVGILCALGGAFQIGGLFILAYVALLMVSIFLGIVELIVLLVRKP